MKQAEQEETREDPRPPREHLGVISKIVKSRGFGFISGDDGEQYFFHAAAVRGDAFDNPQFFEGTRVRFIVAETPKGARALNVVALEEGERG